MARSAQRRSYTAASIMPHCPTSCEGFHGKRNLSRA